MKPLVIYHADCADGFGAAFAAWLKFGGDAEYVPCHYSDDGIPSVLRYSATIKDRNVFILDFGFDRDLMEFYLANARHVVWLDHHKTSFEMWCGKYEKGMIYSDTNGCYGDSNHDIILNDNKSGAMLAWEWFHGGHDIPLFIRHIDDYDRWVFAIEGTREFQRAIWSHAPWSFEWWRDTFYDVEDGFNNTYWSDLYTEGAAILRSHNQQVQDALQNIVPVEIRIPHEHYPVVRDKKTFCGIAVNCSHALASDVGAELARRSGTYGLCWYVKSDGSVKCSIRSASDYDVQVIAKALGGGGHARASGFHIDMKTLMRWLKQE